MDLKKIFEALPHINTIWVKDGEFHLHGNNGGKKTERKDVFKVEKPKVEKPEPKPKK